MANHHPSPPLPLQVHHGPPRAPPPPAQQPFSGGTLSQQIAMMTEQIWCEIGHLGETMGNHEEAIVAYERALRANPQSIPALLAISSILRAREEFQKASEYLQAILKLDTNHGEAWGSLGHCFLMMDDLQQAYAAYQAALVNLRDPKSPHLWYGIGILYDRYGSVDHAEEAFSQVMKMDPSFNKATEIYFRLGIIYKQQQRYGQSLECFKYILTQPPSPLTEEDIWFQIGHVYEQQKDYENAKSAYMRVLERDANHAKVLQQLGWLYHQSSTSFQSQDKAIEFLEKSVAADQTDAQSWYLLGRCYMGQQKYPKAYEAYQQAVYRDGRNPTFWCSIGVLYYQINQYRDALDAYSRAIRLNPYISEVWYDLGTLYESCNNQINDALDAYQRAAELDPGNPHIKARLHLLRNNQGGAPPGQAPVPTDVHPQAYQNAVGPAPPQWPGSASQASQPPPNGPPPGPGSANGWGRISDINPPQPPNPYAAAERGEPFRGQPPPLNRQISPRPVERSMEHMPRMYPEQGRGGLEQLPLRRGVSPPQTYQQPPPPHHLTAPVPPNQQPPRARNPAYPGPPPSAVAAAAGQSMNGPLPNMMAGPSYRTNSPMNNGRPSMHDNRMPSPKSAYMQNQVPYPPHPEQAGPSALEQGLSLPLQSGLHRDHDVRPASVGPKRMREWEDDRESSKKPASEENRARLEDMRHRRPSTPPRVSEPYRRHSSEARRFEEQRRMEEQRRLEDQHRAEEMRRAAEEQQRRNNEVYHPSEAAHHPPSHGLPPHLPPMQPGPSPMQNILHDVPPPPQPGSATKEYPPSEERTRMELAPGPLLSVISEPERAARKMDVDEDYDDSGEENKKPVISASGNGPNAAGSEMKNGTATTGSSINGLMGLKTESN